MYGCAWLSIEIDSKVLSFDWIISFGMTNMLAQVVKDFIVNIIFTGFILTFWKKNPLPSQFTYKGYSTHLSKKNWRLE